jgi:hypothetical protein
MVIRQIDAVAELQAAAELLIARWTLALPTAIASFVVGLFIVAIVATVLVSALGAVALAGRPGGVAALLGAGALTAAAGCIGLVLVVGFAQAVVIAASEDAWHGRSPDFGRAIGRAVTKLPTLIVLFVLVLLLAVIPVMLSFVLIGVPLLLALGFFLMFALPAVIVGGESATGAIASSFRLARANLTPALAAFVAIIIATAIGRIADAMFLHIPLIGLLVTFFVGGLTAAYSALVSVRFYDLLHDAPAA